MTHFKIIAGARVTAALGLLCFAAACGLKPAPVTTRKLQVSGKNLLDEHGRLVLLRGFNASGRSKMPPYMPFDYNAGQFQQAADNYFAALQNLGANVVRLQFLWEALEPTPGARDMTYFSQYLALVDSAYAHGISVIVDMHQDAYASPFYGDGFPIWTLGAIPHGPPIYDNTYTGWSYGYFSPTSDVNQAFQQFWTNTNGIQDSFVSMWQFAAAGLASHPGVAAFEMTNEPGPGSATVPDFEETTLPAFYERVGTAIRAVAGDYPLVGGIPASPAPTTSNLVAPNLPNYVFAAHYYDPGAFVGQTLVDLDQFQTGITNVITLPGSPDVPVIMDEWGMPDTNTAKAAISTAMESLYDQLNLSTIIWDAHVSATLWNGENFSVFNPDGSEQSWADSVVRPYPRAVAGASYTFSFNPTAVTFSLQVQGATSEVTEVYLASRVFGSSPKITTTANWSWIASSETLVLSDAKGANYQVSVSK